MVNENYKLGKQPPKLDQRTLRLENYESFPDPPLERKWSTKTSGYDMLGNDEYSNCGPVGVCNMIRTWTANEGKEVIFTREQCLKIYSDLTGFDPATGQPDPGIVLLDMLKMWKNVGFFGHKIGAFMSLNFRDLRMQRIAINEFGGTLNGIQLPISFQNKDIWDSDILTGDGYPGSWGLHCTMTADYLENGDFGVITWAEDIPATSFVMQEYPDEMYVPLSRDFLNDKNMAPSNFDWDKMTYDLAHIQ